MFFANYLSDTQFALYEVPLDTAAKINVISVINTDVADRSVTFYVYRKVSNTTVPLSIVDYIVEAGQKRPILDQPELNLETGDKILAIGSVANKLSCIVDGVEYSKYRT